VISVRRTTEQSILAIADAVKRDGGDGAASSHWRNEGGLSDHPMVQDPLNFDMRTADSTAFGPLGGISAKTKLHHRIVHWLLQIPLRALGIGLSGFAGADKIAAKIAHAQGRAYDKDLLRHTLTLALLQRHLGGALKHGTIAVIGDGFANMSALLLSTHPNAKVILINLHKSLLFDCVFLRKALPDVNISLVQTEGEIADALAASDVQCIAVAAENAHLLGAAPITLGINILSMMEMDPPVTAAYFNLLRRAPSDKTAFYCCNRIEKTLPDGTVTRFDTYPWDADDEIMVDAMCHWTRLAYHGRPPFYYLSNPVRHRLVYLKKSDA
tara:strand:- start:23014 stop:23991 length:978 start_codon:yes stop_codon:yes gene_type:complete